MAQCIPHAECLTLCLNHVKLWTLKSNLLLLALCFSLFTVTISSMFFSKCPVLLENINSRPSVFSGETYLCYSKLCQTQRATQNEINK